MLDVLYPSGCREVPSSTLVSDKSETTYLLLACLFQLEAGGLETFS